MPKRTPLPCSPENCGNLFPKCGKLSTYQKSRCRCEACGAGWRNYKAKHREKNREAYQASARSYRDRNREAATDYRGPCSAAKCGAWHAQCGEIRTHKERFCRCEACRAAYSEYNRKTRESRIEIARDRDRKYRAENPEARREAKRRYREKNIQKVAEQQRRWKRENAKHVNGINQARRARKRAALIEKVDHTVVFERDGWVCQGCGILCPRDAVWPARNFPTLDHIVALANGGKHSYANAQTLCRICNSSKGARR